jgi:hypothetical protein
MNSDDKMRWALMGTDETEWDLALVVVEFQACLFNFQDFRIQSFLMVRNMKRRSTKRRGSIVCMTREGEHQLCNPRIALLNDMSVKIADV